jgi:enoyl-CoA hydratase
MPGTEPVLYAKTGRVALVTVNDPDRRNAVTDAMSAQLRAAVESAEADTDVHAVVITGAGKAFCAGADLSALGAAAEEGLLRIYDGFMAVANCTLPTIAAVNGAAVGAGLNLALAADVRIAGPRAVFWASTPAAAPPGCCSAASARRSPAPRCCSGCASTPSPRSATGWR